MVQLLSPTRFEESWLIVADLTWDYRGWMVGSHIRYMLPVRQVRGRSRPHPSLMSDVQ